MSAGYVLCDRCGRNVPIEGDRADDGFELCDACVEALTSSRSAGQLRLTPDHGLRVRIHRRQVSPARRAMVGPQRSSRPPGR